MKIAGLEVGYSHPVRVMAEISNAHNGSPTKAIRLIAAAKEAGADIIKFQCYTPDELVALRGDGPAPSQWGEQGWTMRQLYEKAQTPFHWFPQLVDFCKEIGMPWFASVFGPDSLALMESLGCPTYKIAALDNQNDALRTAVLATGKPVVVSRRKAQWQPGDGLVLYCPEGYPQKQVSLTECAGCDGFSYHGIDPLVPVYAVTAGDGVHVIECHIQLDEEPSELEANISLTATQFGTMVREIRKLEAML